MTPLDLTIVLSAVDNASRVLTQVQAKLESLAKIRERMTVVGEGITFAGGFMRAAGDILGLGEATHAAMSFQDEIARVNTVLLPTAAGLKQLGEIKEFAIAQSQHHAYAAEQMAESVDMRLSSFVSAQQAMAANTVVNQAAMGPHGQLADGMRTLGTLYLNFAGQVKLARTEFSRLPDPLTSFQSQFEFNEMGKISSALRHPIAAVHHFHMPLNSELASIAGFFVAGLQDSGSAFAEIMNTSGSGEIEKLGTKVPGARYSPLDLRGLDRLMAWSRAHSPLGMSEKLANTFGIDGAWAELLSAQFGNVGEVQRALETSTGSRARAQPIAVSIASERLQTIGWMLSSQQFSAMARRIGNLISAAQPVPDLLSRYKTIGDVLGDTAVLGCERLKHIDARKNAQGIVSDAIVRFFVGHSPVLQRPLRDLSLPRQIATTLASVPVLRPAMELAPTIARPLGGTSRAATGVTVHYSPTINITGSALTGEEWLKTARKHADELMRIIADKLNRQARLSFI